MASRASVCQERQEGWSLIFLMTCSCGIVCCSPNALCAWYSCFCFKLSSPKDLEDTNAEIHIQNKRESDLNYFQRCVSGGMILSTVRCMMCIGLYFFVSKLLLLLYQRDKYPDHSSHWALTETWQTNSLMLHAVEHVQCIRFWWSI